MKIYIPNGWTFWDAIVAGGIIGGLLAAIFFKH